MTPPKKCKRCGIGKPNAIIFDHCYSCIKIILQEKTETHKPIIAPEPTIPSVVIKYNNFNINVQEEKGKLGIIVDFYNAIDDTYIDSYTLWYSKFDDLKDVITHCDCCGKDIYEEEVMKEGLCQRCGDVYCDKCRRIYRKEHLSNLIQDFFNDDIMKEKERWCINCVERRG